MAAHLCGDRRDVTPRRLAGARTERSKRVDKEDGICTARVRRGSAVAPTKWGRKENMRLVRHNTDYPDVEWEECDVGEPKK